MRLPFIGLIALFSFCLEVTLGGRVFAAPLQHTPQATPQVAVPLVAIERILKPGEAEHPKVGDQLSFKVSAPPSTHLQSDDALEDQGWALLETDPSDPSSEKILKLVSLKSGKRELPSFEIKDEAGKTIGKTSSISVEIESAISPSDPRPDQPEEALPPVGLRFPVWIVVLMSLVGLALLASLTYVIVTAIREKWKRRPKKAEPVLSEDERALLELERLRKLDLVSLGEFKRHYFRISEIVKSYVGERYQFDAPESTTGEMLEYLRKNENQTESEQAVSELSQIFRKLDRVKFTDYVPDSEESSKILDDAKGFVLSTKRMPIIASASEVKASANL